MGGCVRAITEGSDSAPELNFVLKKLILLKDKIHVTNVLPSAGH